MWPKLTPAPSTGRSEEKVFEPPSTIIRSLLEQETTVTITEAAQSPKEQALHVTVFLSLKIYVPDRISLRPGIKCEKNRVGVDPPLTIRTSIPALARSPTIHLIRWPNSRSDSCALSSSCSMCPGKKAIP